MLYHPLIVNDEAVALIQLTNSSNKMGFTEIDVELLNQMKGFFQLTMFTLPSESVFLKSTFYLRIPEAVLQWSNLGLTAQYFPDNKVAYLANSNSNLKYVHRSEGDLLSLLPFSDPDSKIVLARLLLSWWKDTLIQIFLDKVCELTNAEFAEITFPPVACQLHTKPWDLPALFYSSSSRLMIFQTQPFLYRLLTLIPILRYLVAHTILPMKGCGSITWRTAPKC